MLVTAPASSANLGPGFDCLGLAVELPFELRDDDPGDGWLRVESTHPAAVALVAAGGDPARPLWWRSPIPPGRGLGFSGAARVAGAYFAGRLDELDHHAAREGAIEVAARLEGHADNAAASALGGFTLSAGGVHTRLSMGQDLAVVVWWPDASTSTDASRRVLPDQVDLDDAAFSVSRAALWVAAVAAGQWSWLRTACQDRLHQPGRLAQRQDSAAALEALLGSAEVLGAWLSGSGPTVAALVRSTTEAGDLADRLPDGRVRRLEVADAGVHELPTGS